MTTIRRYPPFSACLPGLLLYPSLTCAQASAADSPGVSGTALAQILLVLTLIVALLFAGAFLLRRLNQGGHFGNAGPLRIVSALMVGTRERIVLIEVGESWLVVGIVPGQIKTLHTLPKGEAAPPPNRDKPFGHWLKQLTERHHEQP